MSRRKDGRPRSVALFGLDPLPFVHIHPDADCPQNGMRVTLVAAESWPNEQDTFKPRPGYAQNLEDYS